MIIIGLVMILEISKRRNVLQLSAVRGATKEKPAMMAFSFVYKRVLSFYYRRDTIRQQPLSFVP
jgi:hypothetical protein